MYYLSNSPQFGVIISPPFRIKFVPSWKAFVLEKGPAPLNLVRGGREGGGRHHVDWLFCDDYLWFAPSNKYELIANNFTFGISNSIYCHSFCFWFETSYYSWCYLDYFPINPVSECLKKSNTFWLARVLIEAEAGQDSGNCMWPKLGKGLP